MLFSEPYHFSIRYTSPVLREIRSGGGGGVFLIWFELPVIVCELIVCSNKILTSVS